MSFDIVYAENGDIVAEFDTREEAERGLAKIVDESPHLIGRLGLLAIDADGEPAGALEPAAELLPTA